MLCPCPRGFNEVQLQAPNSHPFLLDSVSSFVQISSFVLAEGTCWGTSFSTLLQAGGRPSWTASERPLSSHGRRHLNLTRCNEFSQKIEPGSLDGVMQEGGAQFGVVSIYSWVSVIFSGAINLVDRQLSAGFLSLFPGARPTTQASPFPGALTAFLGTPLQNWTTCRATAVKVTEQEESREASYL